MTFPTDLRRRVAAANQAIARAGLVTMSFGNVSGVDRDSGTLAIKPSGIPCAEVTAEDLVIVGLEDGRIVEGALRPSTDTPTHRVLYREFAELGGIVHTHSTKATAWAQAGRAIPCFGTTHADFVRGPVLVSRALTDDEIGGEYEWETGRVIAETVRTAGRNAADSPAVLVRSHGPFTWGPTPETAVEGAIALEEIATIAFLTLTLEPSADGIGDSLLGRHFDRKHGPGAYYGQAAPDPEG
jgi:L-ribulose-5-phosphate 4-epimerase